MNSYIDETTKEEFIEDTTIRETIDSIYDMLADLTKEERRAFFEQIFKPKELEQKRSKEKNGIITNDYTVIC